MVSYEPSLEFAKQADKLDPLHPFIKKFNVASSSATKGYFCGHSLGAQPIDGLKQVNKVLQDWASLGVEGYFQKQDGWLCYTQTVVPGLAALVGAHPHEVNIMNSLTTNLHLMAASFYRPTASRYKILMEKNAFSSDKFALESQAKLHGYQPQQAMVWVEDDPKSKLLTTDKIIQLIEQHHLDLALIVLPAVQYLTGQVLDIKTISQKANQYKIPIGVDCAHACGNIALALHDWQVDFAVWCHYKYLNSGPGAPGGVFVHQKHHQSNLTRMAGWWGQDKNAQFDFNAGFKAIEDIRGWQLSCPPMLSLAPIKASLDIFAQADFNQLQTKSSQLTGYLRYLLNLHCPSLNIITPKQQAGAQLSIDVGAKADALCDALKQAGFYCDARHPYLRIAPVPLYNTYTQVYALVTTLKTIIGEQDAVA